MRASQRSMIEEAGSETRGPLGPDISQGSRADGMDEPLPQRRFPRFPTGEKAGGHPHRLGCCVNAMRCRRWDPPAARLLPGHGSLNGDRPRVALTMNLLNHHSISFLFIAGCVMAGCVPVMERAARAGIINQRVRGVPPSRAGALCQCGAGTGSLKQFALPAVGDCAVHAKPPRGCARALRSGTRA